MMEAIPYWHRQSQDEPLFPDMLWSRPENRLYAGKLLIVGGNEHGFSGPAEAYTHATKAGIGTCRVILPSKLERKIGKLFPEIEFAPSTPSGSFARSALSEIISASGWADGTLLAGDFGKNSETTIMLEAFIQKYDGMIVIAADATDALMHDAEALCKRDNVVFVLEFSQLQKLATANRFTQAFTSDQDLVHFVEALHDLSESITANLVVRKENDWFVAAQGSISSTPSSRSTTEAAAHASVWLLQNSSKPFEALTSSFIS